jgi:hypothetical protein
LLCFNHDETESDNQRPTALCKTLRHLLICLNKRVTKHGAQIALNSIATLKFLYHEKTFEIMLELTQKELDQNVSKIPSFPRGFPIVRLTIYMISSYESGSIGQVIQFCPSLTSVEIFAVNEITDADLLSLKFLNNLKRLDVKSRRFFKKSETDERMEDLKTTFQGGIVPLLKKFGHSLEILDITFIYLVDIWTILKFCPYLMSLRVPRLCDSVTALSESELTLYRNEKERFILKNLVELKCTDCCSTCSQEILPFLLSFPSLQEICITDCDAITDEFLHNVPWHTFTNLKRLDLCYCDFLTKQGVDALMTHHNCIEEIIMKSCPNLTPSNAYDWNLQAKRNNWKLKISFKILNIERYYNTDSVPTIGDFSPFLGFRTF